MANPEQNWTPLHGPSKWLTRAVEAGKAAAEAVRPVAHTDFQSRFINLSAPAISASDIADAAKELNVSEKHIHAVRKVESGPHGSYDSKGRPIILPEPHIFSRLTDHDYDATHPSTSSRRWNRRLYPKGFDGRWKMLERMYHLDRHAALQSASWGLFQVMGFHYEALGHETPRAFVQTMVDSEAGHLAALVGFIKANRLQGKLRQCRAGSPESCRAFVKAYNGSGYAANNYHVKFARALR